MAKMNRIIRHWQLTEVERPWTRPMVPAVIRLPGQRFLLMYEGRDGAGGAQGRGFIVIGPRGRAIRVAFSAGTSKWAESYFYHVHINRAGTLMAVADAHMSTGKSAMHIVRLDGQASGAAPAVCASRPDTTTHTWPHSAIFGGGHMYYNAGKVVGPHHTGRLYRTPLACSPRTREVMFPLGRAVEAHTANIAGVSADGSKLAAVVHDVKAGDNGDVMVVDTASGGVVNITGDPARYGGYGPQGGQMMHFNDGLLRVSPTGKRVAYTRYRGGWRDLYVRDTGGKGPAAHLTRASSFSPAIRYVRAIEWITDGDLVFWAGRDSAGMDMYHYRVSTDALSNLTRTGGGTAPPFGGSGKAFPVGGWWGPDRTFMYFLQGSQGARDVRALDTRTFTVKEITRGVTANPESVQAAPRGDRVFFAARGSTGSERLYMLNHRAGTPAVRLFSAKSGKVTNIAPSPDGARVVFDADGATHAATPGGTVTRLADLASASAELFAPSAELIYAVKKSGRVELRIQPLAGGPSRLLDDAGALIEPLTVF